MQVKCSRLATRVAMGMLTLLVAGCVSTDGEVRTAFQNYRDAVTAGEVDRLRTLMAREKTAVLDSPDAESMLAFLTEMTPTAPEISSLVVDGERAEIKLYAEVDGQAMTGTASLITEDGAWKMFEEVWEIDFASSFDITSRLGQSESPLEIGLYVPAHEGEVTQVAFTPDGQHLISIGYNDFYLRIWNLFSEELTFEIELDDRPKDLAVSPDGTFVIVGDVKGWVKKWPLANGILGEPEQLMGGSRHLTQLALNHDGTRVAATHWDGPVEVWDLTKRERPMQLANSQKHRGVDFSPTEPLVVCGGHDNTFSIWNLGSTSWFGKRKRIKVPRASDRSDVWCISVSRDGRYMATGHMDSSISIWDLKRRKQMHNFYVRDASAMATLFSPDGAVLATAQQNGRVYFWDTKTARRLGELRAHDGAVHSLAFNTASSYILATGGEDGQILLYQ